VPGDGGDALALIWTMRWVTHAAPHGWSALWNANIFFPARHTLAYSDSLLPLAPAFGVLVWLTGSVALSFNLLSLAAWTTSLCATDRLARRLGCGPGPAMVAASMFTFSAPRLAQYRHLQLAWGCLIPTCLLLLLRLLEDPSLGRGVAFGTVTAVLTMIASYFGVLVVLASAVIVVLHVALQRRRGLAVTIKALCVAIASFAVLVSPVAYQYLRLQRDPHFRRLPDPTFDAHWNDFRAVSVDNRFVQRLWPVAHMGVGRSGENWLFPGYLATGLVLLALVVLVRRRGAVLTVGQRRELGFLLVAGAVMFVLSFGSPMHVAGRSVRMPFALVRRLVPGASAMRVPARFAVLPMLAVALLAAAGLEVVFGGARRRVVAATCAVLVIAGLWENAIRIETVPANVRQTGAAVNHELARRPAGAVLELPAMSLGSGAGWGFVEAPRQLASTIDWDPRVNGYSSFEPGGFEQLVQTLNGFPNEPAWRDIGRLHVRYIVLRTSIPVDIGPARRSLYESPGVGVIDDAAARSMIMRLPADRVRRVDHVGDAYLIELRQLADQH
ncbi:MAG: hypothetical protein QOF07_2757, partial [Bradyrhizobium sp.]|nr:hypothetical protein [Bradyrhizobium sp.]